MSFKPNKRFKRDYDRLFAEDPAMANLFLLTCELADRSGQLQTRPEELAALFNARFEDPEAYSL